MNRFPQWRRIRMLIIYGCLLGILFLPFIVSLVRFALRHSLHSHIVLILAVSIWLAWQQRDRIARLPHPAVTHPVPAALVALTAAALAYGLDAIIGSHMLQVDRLFIATIILVSAFLAGIALLQGPTALRVFAAPAFFLYFSAPLPTLLTDLLNRILQHASAWTLAGLLRLTPVPVLREGLVFHLPGFTLYVAQECSGIRSTVVLLITATLATILFLNAPWRRALLVACVLPIAALRNAARILTLALGAYYIDPAFLDGPVHKRGGPPFFVLSLIPLFLTLLLLRYGERRGKQDSPLQGDN